MNQQLLESALNFPLVAPPQALDLLGQIFAIEVGEPALAQQRALFGAPLSVVDLVWRQLPFPQNLVHRELGSSRTASSGMVISSCLNTTPSEENLSARS